MPLSTAAALGLSGPSALCTSASERRYISSAAPSSPCRAGEAMPKVTPLRRRPAAPALHPVGLLARRTRLAHGPAT